MTDNLKPRPLAPSRVCGSCGESFAPTADEDYRHTCDNCNDKETTK